MKDLNMNELINDYKNGIEQEIRVSYDNDRG